jgi:hypothetical protein
LTNAGIMQLFQTMQAQTSLTLGAVEKVLKADERPKGPTFLEIAAALGPALAALNPIISKMLEGRKDPTDLALKVVTAMKQTTPASSSGDMVEVFREGMALASRMNPRESAGGDSVMPVVAEGIKTLGTIVAGIMAERASAAGHAPASIHAPRLPASPITAPELRAGAPIAEGLPVIDRPWLAAARPLFPSLMMAARFMGPRCRRGHDQSQPSRTISFMI